MVDEALHEAIDLGSVADSRVLKAEWAVWVDVTRGFDDFHKLVPKMAHEVHFTMPL